jgi:hypothetical protein
MALAKWDDVEPPATLAGYIFTLKNTNVASPAPIVPTITPNGSGSACSAPVPAALLVPGTFTVTATNAFASTVSAPFVGAAPAPPTGLVII